MMRATLALLLLCAPAAASGTVSGSAAVIDGDAIELRGAHLHLYGIDAPESAQSCETAEGREYRCEREAARALRAHIGVASVTCERRDEAGRDAVAGLCHVYGDDLSAWMVAQGYALARRHVTPAYVQQEGQAWATRRGLWAGTFEKPADWRQNRRLAEAAAKADDAD